MTAVLILLGPLPGGGPTAEPPAADTPSFADVDHIAGARPRPTIIPAPEDPCSVLSTGYDPSPEFSGASVARGPRILTAEARYYGPDPVVRGAGALPASYLVRAGAIRGG